jgi:predicted RNA-binding Zn-ribbon protein involved in translation (DUF1610 family)
MWEQNVIDFKKDWYMLSFSVKWSGARSVKTHALPDYPLYKRDKENDRDLVKDFWRVLNDADIVVAHNGDAFDLKKGNTRFVQHGLRPPAPFKSIDTLKIARRYFKFDSNRLNDLGRSLRVGRKLPHTGKHLWFGCMAGHPHSWRIMKRYNARDVLLLERVYLKLRPWAGNHPDARLYSESPVGCPTCGSAEVHRRGVTIKLARKYHRFQCKNCGRWFHEGQIKGRTNETPQEKDRPKAEASRARSTRRPSVGRVGRLVRGSRRQSRKRGR